MNILILTPVCFAMALARYGASGHTYIVMREEANAQRHRGRDLNLRHQHLLKIMRASGVEFHEYSSAEIAAVVSLENRDLAVDFQLTGKLWRLGILPVDNNGAEDRKRVELLSFGSDNLIPFSNFTNYFMSTRAFKENRIWKKHFRNLRADAMIIPSNNSEVVKYYRQTKLVTLAIEDIRKANLHITSSIMNNLPREFVENNSKELLVLSPESAELSLKHVSEIVKAANKVIGNNPEDFEILIKPHPSSPVADVLINEITSKFNFLTLNQKLNIDSKVLQSIPIEFIFFSKPNSFFVGVPSSSIVFLNSSRVELVSVPLRKLRAQYKRSYKYFLQLNQFDSPF